MKHTRKNRTALALAALLTLSPNAPLLLEVSAQSRPVAINAGPSGPVFVPGVNFSPSLSGAGVSSSISSLGSASLPQGVSLRRYEASAAANAAPAAIPGVAGTVRAENGSRAAPAAGLSAAGTAREEHGLRAASRVSEIQAQGIPLPAASIDIGRIEPARTDPTTIQETGGRAAAIETLRLGEKAAAEALRPRAVSEESSAEIGRPFDASRSAEGTAGSSLVEVPSRTGAARTASLEKADARPADAAAAEVPAPAAEDASPKQSVSRAAKYGLVTGALMLAFNFTVSWAAETLGYVPHSNYEAPALPEAATLGDAGSLFFMAAVMAPIVEEIVFRAGLLSGIEWLTRKAVRRGAGVIASVLSSAIFVVLHETADPFLIGVRMAGALLMAATYKREGLMASIILHAVNNGVLIAGMLLSAFLPSGLALAVSAGGLLLGAGAAAWAGRSLWAQRRDRSEGRIGRYELTSKSALILAALLGLGALLLSPKLILVNLPFVAGLGFYAWRKRAKV